MVRAFSIIITFAFALYAGVANAKTSLPAVECAQFRRLGDGGWQGSAWASITIGGDRIGFSRVTIRPGSGAINGYDLYRLIERNCRTARRDLKPRK